jgi:aconitate hydratase
MTCAVRSPKAMMMIENATQGRMFQVRHSMSPRQVEYVLQGGRVNGMKERLTGSAGSSRA